MRGKMFYILLALGLLALVFVAAFPVLAEIASVLHSGNDARTVEVEQIVGDDFHMIWTVHNVWYNHPEKTVQGVMYCDDIADVHVIKENPTKSKPVKIICYDRYIGMPFPLPTPAPTMQP